MVDIFAFSSGIFMFILVVGRMASEILQKASEAAAAAAMPEVWAFKEQAAEETHDDALPSDFVKLEEVHSTMCCPTC